MTFLEILAVLAIVALMLALSAGAYIHMTRSFSEQAAAADLEVALRQARNAAISSNTPAFVELDVENRRIVPWVYRTVGFWHFEDRNDFGKTTGAYHNAVMRGAELFPEGKVGKCVRLHEGGCVDLGADPDFDCEDGGYLEAYIRPGNYTFTGDNFIFFKKNAYELKIGLRGILAGTAGGHAVKASGYHIVPGRWTKVALAWDLYTVRLLVDDALMAAGPGGKTPLSDYPLLIGHDTASMEGLVDEVRVMSASPGNVVQLPSSYTIEHTAAPWSAVYFAGDGSLDLRYHPGPLSITLIQGQHARRVDISMLGQTSRAEVETVEPKDTAAPAVAATFPPKKKTAPPAAANKDAPPKIKDPEQKAPGSATENKGGAP